MAWDLSDVPVYDAKARNAPSKGLPTPLVRKARQSSMTRPCQRCGNTFTTIASRGSVVFCGQKCAASFRADKTRKPRVACVCGKPASSPTTRSCSSACAYRARKLRRMKPLTCPVCFAEHWPKGNIRWKYCSKRCYDKERAKAWRRIPQTCIGCDGVFERPANIVVHRKRPFCTRECFSRWNVGVNSSLYRGDVKPIRGKAWAECAESIRQRDGYRCRRCGKSQEENGRKLPVDHIRPRRAFSNRTEADRPENLAALCSRCHNWKTHTVERKWLRGDALGLQQFERSIGVPL